MTALRGAHERYMLVELDGVPGCKLSLFYFIIIFLLCFIF